MDVVFQVLAVCAFAAFVVFVAQKLAARRAKKGSGAAKVVIPKQDKEEDDLLNPK